MEEYQEYKELVKVLYKEIPILTAQIRAVYRELDKKFHLRGAQVPITFGVEKELLGSYTRGEQGEKEHFHFSLLFVGYAVKHPLSKEDRMDLYKHEYAPLYAASDCHSGRIPLAGRHAWQCLEILLFADRSSAHTLLPGRRSTEKTGL